MPNTQLLRRRIKSITNTRQITKAMELVAAAKMRKAQELALKSRLYSENATESLTLLSAISQKVKHPLFRQPNITNTEDEKGLLIIVTSDRGLAGSYNNFCLRLASNFLQIHKNFEIITVGKKSQDFFNKTNIKIVATFTELPPYPMFRDVLAIVSVAIGDFLKNKYNVVKIIYTKFHSTIRQEAILDQFLPIVPLKTPDIAEKSDIILNEYGFEPNEKDVLNYVVPRLVEVLFYQKILESIASEHSARMVAMKNASDNAGDIIKDLQLTYNSVRQASITQELAEITAGANAL